ncbi:unnamed protein product [Orchesella dallaii]|uniref:Peptidase M14 domain-containing protein n=1 Tax=Orchesella dallaii TaxID=48710 RepID=A0ABP1RW69_9HEXA
MERLLDVEGLALENNPVALVLPTLACLFSTLSGGRKSYNGYQVLRVNLTSTRAFNTINGIYLTNTFDFLTPPVRNNATDLVVCPEQLLPLKGLFRTLRIPYEVAVPNLEKEIAHETIENNLRLKSEGGMNWNAYQKLTTIQNWMDDQAHNHPQFLSTENYGTSTEGRHLKVLKISTGGGGSKPAVWLDGGIHAREWISPATVSYIANELIKIAEEGESNENYRLVNAVDWYINPNLNPDGYEYTQIDRMWRKTRSGNMGFLANAFGCIGTDPNRNWEYQWGGKGTSNNPCSQIYRGTSAASEPEVKLTQDYVYARREQIKLFLTFHAYSQMIFTPWGYDDVPIDDKEDLMIVARNAAKALKDVHGTEFQSGSSPELLYAAAGGSEDFAKGKAGIKFAYCYELRDTGKHGFILPPGKTKAYLYFVHKWFPLQLHYHYQSSLFSLCSFLFPL